MAVNMPNNLYQQATPSSAYYPSAPVVATPMTSAGPNFPVAHAVAVGPSWHPPAMNLDYLSPHLSFNQGSTPYPSPPPSLAVPQTNEELNTFSYTLKAFRETLLSLVTMPIDDFRSDDAHPTALCIPVMELAEIMKEYSANECDWGD